MTISIVLSNRTSHPTSRWVLFDDVSRRAEHLLRCVVDQKSLINAWRLFVFLAKKHGHPTALDTPGYTFPLCRRALCRIEELGLTEGQIKRAIPVLKTAGLIYAVKNKASVIHRRVKGGVWAIAIQYALVSEMKILLRKAQRRKADHPKSKGYKTNHKIMSGSEAPVLGQSDQASVETAPVVVEPRKPLYDDRDLIRPRPRSTYPPLDNIRQQKTPVNAATTAARPIARVYAPLDQNDPLQAALARLAALGGFASRSTSNAGASLPQTTGSTGAAMVGC